MKNQFSYFENLLLGAGHGAALGGMIFSLLAVDECRRDFSPIRYNLGAVAEIGLRGAVRGAGFGLIAASCYSFFNRASVKTIEEETLNSVHTPK
ncbi:MAG: hypothetical protein WC785_00525 [Tatlockia sp.]|jgi:hypothetical protein